VERTAFLESAEVRTTDGMHKSASWNARQYMLKRTSFPVISTETQVTDVENGGRLYQHNR
ncbi:Hypothetical predicted protein, partial [Pelobates cultripes]